MRPHREVPAGRPPPPRSHPGVRPVATSTERYDVVVAGLGPAGLSAMRELKGAGLTVIGLEAEREVGGLARSHRVGAFTFDHTGHLFHFKGEWAKDLARRLLAGNIVEHRRDSKVRFGDLWTDYPFQCHPPPPVADECLRGMEAAAAREPDRTNFRTWVESTFGDGVARHFMRPYNEKMWTVPLERLTCDWIGYIPKPSERARKDIGYNQYFWYPREGGCGALAVALAREAAEAGEVVVGEGVTAVHTGERWIETASGRRLGYRFLVSSIPLPVLVAIDAAAPADARAAAGRLEWVSVYNLNLGVSKPTRVGHWAYFAEPEYVFYRVGFYHTFSETMAPPGHSSYYVEVSYSRHRPLPDDVDRRIEEGLIRAGLLDDPSQIVARLPLEIDYAYSLPTHERRPAAAAIRAYLKDRSVEPVGRYGRWEYTAIEEALVEGRDAARRVRAALGTRT